MRIQGDTGSGTAGTSSAWVLYVGWRRHLFYPQTSWGGGKPYCCMRMRSGRWIAAHVGHKRHPSHHRGLIAVLFWR